MAKITDAAYRLPEIEAFSTFNIFDKGTTIPLAVWGVDTATGERGQYVVKLKHSDRMTTTSSAFELIGAWMAMELELPVVRPALVNVSAAFVETVREGYRAASQSQGINFGSKYQSGFSNLPQVSFYIPEEFVETIKMIYVFDLFIANTDRGHERPNVQSNGTGLLIYDHELAFSFIRLLPFLRNKTPWILNEGDRDLYQKHFFFKYLKEMKPDLTQQVAMLERFNDDFWNKVYATLPPEWMDEQVMEIRPHLTSIIENRTYFAESLNKTLVV
jgi:hypothetical protein